MNKHIELGGRAIYRTIYVNGLRNCDITVHWPRIYLLIARPLFLFLDTRTAAFIASTTTVIQAKTYIL